MLQSATARVRFAVPAPLRLEAAFDGGRLTSDGGLPWVGEAHAGCGRLQHGGAPPRRGLGLVTTTDTVRGAPLSRSVYR